MRSLGRSLALALAVAVSVPSLAEGADPVPSGDRPAEFRADRVEIEPGKERLDLRGNVEISVDRYRLTSDHLSLERGRRGMVVTGSGRVALCPCPDPPFTFGFRSATVAPPTDLLLEQPTLRAFGVPVLWMPYLWLRAPSRVGLLPLRVAYRGEDGLLLGSGLHLPLAERAALDLGLAGYLRGGAEVDARLTTDRTTTDLAWDYLRTSAVRADLRGSLGRARRDGSDGSDRGAAVAWSLDGLRGARALAGPSPLEDVSRRQDRARAFAGFSGDGGVVGLVLSAAGVRGGPLRSIDAVGPGAHAGLGAALGESVSVDGDVDLTTFQEPGDGATTLLAQRGELRADARAGPIVLGGEARSRGMATFGTFSAGHTVAAGVGADASLPLVKTFGPVEAPTQHWIVPFVTGIGGVMDTAHPSVVPALLRDGVFFAASGGVRSTLGEAAQHRSAISVSARAGAVGEGRLAPRSLVAWSARARAPYAAIAAEGAHSTSGSRGDWATSEARLGREDGPYVGARVVTSSGFVPIAGRLLSGGWDAPWLAWLSASGWSAGGRAGAPWTRWLASAVDVEYDVTSRTWLTVRGTLAYRHPCGCLAVTLWSGHRLGRGGVDSWLTVDLAR